MSVTLRPYTPTDEDSAIELWRRTWAQHYPRIDFNARVVMCDIAAWRLFGISMAGYNAMISLGAALLGAFALVRHKA